MYPVSNQFLEAVRSDSIETNLTGTIGSATFTKNNIVAGSFHISNQCTDTSDITLGSVFLGQLTCTFIDVEIAYTNWIGKDITPTLSVKVGENAWESVPLGVFRIMEAKHTAEGVMVTAYDNMRKFDRKIKKAHFKNVVGSLYTFVATMCTDCHVTLGMSQSDFEDLPNATEEVTIFGYTNETKKYSNDIETYRDLLFYVAQTMGCFATIDRNGQLVFRNYKSNVAETISDRQRLSGAQFADYITNYTGIYVTNMKDDTEDYYGYDYELINAEIELVNQEILQIESDLVELQRQYDEHEITEEEYLAQKKALETERKQCNKRLNWLYKARDKAQAGEEGTFMDLGANPFLQDDSSTVRERMRRRVLKALDPISYTPFTCDSVMGAHYDLGDVIYFTGGHAGTDGVFCCLMAFDWTYNAEYQMQGFGVDPSISNTKTRTQKQSKSANTNAVTAIDYAQTAQDTADSKAQDFVSTAYPSASQGKDGDIAVIMMPPFPMKHIADYPGWNTDTFTQNSDGTYKIELSGHTITTGSDPNTVCFEIDGFEESGTYHVDCSVKFLGSQGGAWAQGLGPYIGYSKDFSPNGISVIAGQEGTFITDSYGGGLINIESGSDWHDYSFDFYYSKIMSPDGKMWLKITTDRNYIYGPETPASMYIDNFKITGTTTKPYKVKTIQVKKDGRWNNVDYDDEIETTHDETDGELIANIKNSDGSTTPIYQKAVKPNKNSETPSSNLKELQIGDTDYIIRAQNKVFQYQQTAEQIGAIEGDLYAQICDESGIYIGYEGAHASDIWRAMYFKLTEDNSAYFYKLIGEAGYSDTGSEPGMRLLIFNCPVGETVTFDLTVCIRRIAQAFMYLSYDDTKPLGVCFYDPEDSLPTLPTTKTGAWHSDINYQEFNKDSVAEGGTVYTYTCTFTAMSETICAYIDMAGLVLNDIDVDKEIDFRIAPHDMNLTLKHLYIYGLPEGADPEIAKWYEIGQGGGGSSVVPNPAGTPTNDLKTVKIDDTIYAVKDSDAIHSADVGTAAGKDFTTSISSQNTDLPTSGAVKDAIDAAISSAYKPSGSKTIAELVSSLLVAANMGNVYNMSDSGETTSDFVEGAGKTINTGDNVGIVNIGTDANPVYKFDLLSGFIDMSDYYDKDEVDDLLDAKANNTPTFTEASERTNLAGSGETMTTILGKIKKFFSDLKTVAFSGSYNDLSNKPTIPTVNNGTLTIQKNGTNVQTFSANQSGNATANIECAVPSDVEGSKVVTGNPLTITDASPIKAEKMEIGFEPKQDLHGYDKPWVGGAGKNKIILTSAKIKQRNTSGTWTNNSYTWNGITYALTVDSQDNVTNIALSGTRSGESFLYLANQDDIYTYSKSIAGNQMTLNGCPANGGSDKYYISAWISGSGTKSDYGSGVNVTYPASFTQCNITLGVASGYAISGSLNFRPMLRLASITDSSFAPYKNECPITGYTSLSADGCGKNLINVAGQTITTQTYILENFPIEKGEYTVSFVAKNNSNIITYFNITPTGSDNIRIYIPANSPLTTYTQVISIAADTTLRFLCNGASAGYSFTVDDIQLEHGSEATPYEPYNSRNVTVQFNQTLYGGKLTILQDGSAEVLVDRGYLVKNTSAMNNTEDYPGWTNSGIKDLVGAGKNEVVTTFLNVGTKVGYNTNGNYNICWLPVDEYGLSQTQWIALAIDVQITVLLATPFTLHLSPVETLTLLQGLNNVWTDGTTLSLTYQPDNAIGQAKGTAQDAMETAQDAIAMIDALDSTYLKKSNVLMKNGDANVSPAGYRNIGDNSDYITLSEEGTYLITAWAMFKGGTGNKAVLICRASDNAAYGQSWENSTINQSYPKTFTCFHVATVTINTLYFRARVYTDNTDVYGGIYGGIYAIKVS